MPRASNGLRSRRKFRISLKILGLGLTEILIISKDRAIIRFMKIFSRFVLAGACFCFPFIAGQDAFSQQLKGQYNPQPKVVEEETLDPVVPRVFSSQVSDVQKAEKLDQALYSLTLVLNGFVEVDATYKERLFELLQPYKFQVTRRGQEFRKDIASAKKTVKESYDSLNNYVEQYRVNLKAELENFKPEDRKIIEQISEEALKSYLVQANKYFDLQARFIKTYQKLVTFILKNSGGYYHTEGSKVISFYDPGIAESYAKLFDTLTKINFNQVQLVRDMQSGPSL